MASNPASRCCTTGYKHFAGSLQQGVCPPWCVPPGVTDDLNVMGWINEGTGGNNPHTTKEVDPIIHRCIEYLRDEHGMQRLGAVGYCFCAKYVCRFPKGDGLIDVGYLAHPSFVSEEKLKAIKLPISIAAAEDDFTFADELRHLTERVAQGDGAPVRDDDVFRSSPRLRGQI
ncbi:uncharacterized protein Z520_10784 [Fonsecaea multimorphosa CBS 102226]|uniref:Dienelactone hydrolase domain-containing protein n=1 Tax=Fonsecaea multimorphosa CBS 102226 TaxID=1442371 RepID=A0A0D2I8T7_9EURO|nr:uncharacterized protein Z520_10784 [Fonsecaea multimorphosa CBS 102226]KIX93606.1 hypothetical protein Z520_10784 [Fonsecaea multimorphosa CBS 102226]